MAGKTARDSPRIYLLLSPVPECLKRAMKLKERSFTGHLSTTAIFLTDSPCMHSCFNLSTMATFFCSQGGRCTEIQL